VSTNRLRIPEFYKLSVEERVRIVHERGLINTSDFRALASGKHTLELDAARLRLTVERGRLIRGEDGLHPLTATAKATAFVFSWVNVIKTRVTPRTSARRPAFPSRTIDGAPLGCRLTWMSCQRFPR